MEDIKLEEVQPMDLVPSKEDTDKLEIEKVDYKTLNKEQLLDLLNSKDKSIENYKATQEVIESNHNNELNNINEYYKQKIKELTNLIKYYERKFKVLKDILDIETGGEK